MNLRLQVIIIFSLATLAILSIFRLDDGIFQKVVVSF